jgi:DNA-binding transcriptional LysR family regulator
MDLRRARTFVTIAQLGTVSKAAQQLRVAQPALSRQIADLERELGFKLFDRVGRRLVLTTEGEQFLSDCRGLLNYATAAGERAELLRRGDTGTLKVAASPQHIESVLAQFLHGYAQRFPNVAVTVIEAGGRESLAMLERGDIHLSQNLLHAVEPDDPHFASLPFGSVDLLAASHPSQILAKGQTIEISKLATLPLLLLESEYNVRRPSMPPAAWRECDRTSAWQATRRTRSWHWPKPATGWRSSRHSFRPTAMICESCASPIAANRCASHLPCCGTDAVRCRAMPSPIARCCATMSVRFSRSQRRAIPQEAERHDPRRIPRHALRDESL